MKKYYIAAFVPEEDGSGYSVYFPDVPRCFTGGETLEEAMFMAEDVLRLVLQDMAGGKERNSAPSGLEAVRKKVEEERALDGLSTPADTVYQLVAAPGTGYGAGKGNDLRSPFRSGRNRQEGEGIRVYPFRADCPCRSGIPAGFLLMKKRPRIAGPLSCDAFKKELYLPAGFVFGSLSRMSFGKS